MTTTKPVVLVAPLDWGLGHTVRCIPIIRAFEENGCEVLVACNSEQKQILSRELPCLQAVHLQGYDIRYGKSRFFTLLRICLQLPKILTRINQENDWLKRFLLTTKIDAIVSDNRYGLFSDDTLSIFLTHQLGVRSGLNKLIDRIIQRILYLFINKFSVCWIPDWENAEVNAGGRLSHPFKTPDLPIRYLGCLSRLEKCVPSPNSTDVLIILSGPEPQRTILEEIILVQLAAYTGTAVVVRGVFDGSTINSHEKIMILNNASGAEINQLLCNADVVISRSGYTSIMDILKLRKRSILIPTPGQAEQEYLASYLHGKRIAYAVDQKNFSLNAALKDSLHLVNEHIAEPMDDYKNVIQELVRSLKAEGINRRA